MTRNYYRTVKILKEIDTQLKNDPDNLLEICEEIRQKYKLLSEDGTKWLLNKNYTMEDAKEQGVIVCTKNENNVKRVNLFINDQVGYVEYKNGKTIYQIANSKSSRI